MLSVQTPISQTTQPQQSTAVCHGPPEVNLQGLPLVAIVGSPNVGKSVLFHKLTGVYATVSNYPGTTVEITRGKTSLGNLDIGVLDTPGMYSLLPITDEERVARKILLNEHPGVIVHMTDAKNLERMLPMTMELIEAGLPVVLALNLMDEAEQLGIQIDLDRLRQHLRIPVIGTALAYNRGAAELKRAILDTLGSQDGIAANDEPSGHINLIKYPQPIENALNQLTRLFQHTYSLSARALGLLLLQNDLEVGKLVQQWDNDHWPEIMKIIQQVQDDSVQPLPYVISRSERRVATIIVQETFRTTERISTSWSSRLSDAMIRPITGLPILLVALILLYEFIGVFGAQTLVGWLETFFVNVINPWIDGVLVKVFPWVAIRSLFGGEFGMITLGLRYAFAIVLPIVGTFFLAFSFIEDSGYLPRLAMLIDRFFKKIGLNGRAVIPIVLGFGCDTMATITTRTLETRRERVISTLLLSLAIPCSAQLGVMLALLSAFPMGFAAWLAIIVGVFFLVGYLSARLMPGEKPVFYMELPPLRWPRSRNVLIKTYTRMEWYLREVFPLFILASVLIWIGTMTGLFDLAIGALIPVVRWLGLPDQVATAFLFGFFRRDYGAAGLYDLRQTMNQYQLLIAVVTMTLFIPCIAQLAVTIKERGWKTAVAMIAFIFPFALLVGAALSSFLRLIGVM